MKYQIRFEKSFIKRMDNLGKLFGLSAGDVRDARETFLDAVSILSSGAKLSDEFADHELNRQPCNGYREFHVPNDLLVIYYQVDAKKRLRMITVTNHEELTTGKLPH
ncbi:type II toxin-antitoxin system mRNA interferase toxin, RelE/StbE family, partial [Lactobacillus sp. XV13L]|nr:type II toxin-antitoxin system mRNA interferase toxin, RelE/StbE family [Lactobacillus sp. XV13L]